MGESADPSQAPIPPDPTGLGSRIACFMRHRWIEATVLGLWIIGVAFISPISRTESHEARLWIAVFTIGMTGLYTVLRIRGGSAQRLPTTPVLRVWRLLATMAILFGFSNYYNHNAKWFAGLDDYTDATYYYLNSKYFDELGYTGLYEAVLTADLEGPNRVTKYLKNMRDLETYEIVPIKKALRTGPPIQDSFSEEDWAQFKHDANWFMARKLEIQGGLNNLKTNFFVDHGYNPPPAWTLAGGLLSKAVPVESVKLITSVDLVLVLGMFAMIAAAFGIDVMLIVALWWFCTFSGRWPVMTHSLLRFDWVVAFPMAMCALKMRRFALGAGLLSWSMLSRIFPFIFGVPVLAVMAWRDFKARSLSRSTRRFILGGIGTTLIISALAWVDVGTGGYVGSAKNLVMHNSDPDAYSSQKVGLGDAMFFRMETSRKQMSRSRCGTFEDLIGIECKTHRGIHGKAKLIKKASPITKGVGILALLGVIAWAIRTRRPLYELPALGVLPLFCLTNPSYYYYTLRVGLVLWHAQDLRKPRNIVGIMALLVLEVVSQWTKIQGWPRYTTTGTISWGLVAYFTVMGSVALWECRKPARVPESEE